MQEGDMVYFLKILGQMIDLTNCRPPTNDGAIGLLVVFGVGDYC